MSATGRNLVGNERRADDFYATPAWCTRAILPFVSGQGTVLDPCCGEGAILDVFRDAGRRTAGLEIDSGRASRVALHALVVHRDALAPGAWPAASAIVTNPPYSIALDFIRRAAEEAPEVDRAFLLRLNFLGSQKRAAYLRSRMPDVYVLPRRPSFTNGGTDATEYAWMVWGPGRGGKLAILDLDGATS